MGSFFKGGHPGRFCPERPCRGSHQANGSLFRVCSITGPCEIQGKLQQELSRQPGSDGVMWDKLMCLSFLICKTGKQLEPTPQWGIWHSAGPHVCISMSAVCVFHDSVVSESLQPHRLQPTRILSTEFPKQKYWSELPFPLPGYLSSPGIEPGSLASPCIGRWILYHWATWEAPVNVAQTSVYTGVTISITGDFSWGSELRIGNK